MYVTEAILLVVFLSVIRFDCFGLDNHGGVAVFLHCAAGRYDPCHIAGLESQGDCYAGDDGGGDSHHELIDLLLGHTL